MSPAGAFRAPLSQLGARRLGGPVAADYIVSRSNTFITSSWGRGQAGLMESVISCWGTS